MRENQISIACLPVAGTENPYQYLMIDGLNSSGQINAFNGLDDRFFGILRTTFKYQPDYLHFDWITSYYERQQLWMTLLLLPFFYLQILFVKYLTKTEMVWTLHNITPHNVKYINLHKRIRSFFAKYCKWIRVFSETSIDRAVKELNVSREKFIIIPEGDYTTIYPNTITKKEAREQFKVAENKIVLVSLGYIKPYKGLENLIDQFSKIKNKQIELIIAGESMNVAYLELLKKSIIKNNEQRIRLIDTFIPVEKLQVYYNVADVVVLPFEKVENSGSVIMAMGFKKAIVAPRMGVLEKRLEKQKILLYDNLLSGLNSIFAIDKFELENIGKQNHLALQHYKWEDFATAFK